MLHWGSLVCKNTRTLLTKGGTRVDLNDGDAADAVLRREAQAGRRVMLIASSAAPPTAPRRSVSVDVVAIVRHYADAINWSEIKDALRALALSVHPDARLIDFRDDAFGNAVRSRAPPRRSGRPRIAPDFQGDPMNMFF